VETNWSSAKRGIPKPPGEAIVYIQSNHFPDNDISVCPSPFSEHEVFFFFLKLTSGQVFNQVKPNEMLAKSGSESRAANSQREGMFSLIHCTKNLSTYTKPMRIEWKEKEKGTLHICSPTAHDLFGRLLYKAPESEQIK
jgi:hypothetical protein